MLAIRVWMLKRRVLALWPEDVDITEDMEYNVIIDNVSERYWPSHLR